MPPFFYVYLLKNLIFSPLDFQTPPPFQKLPPPAISPTRPPRLAAGISLSFSYSLSFSLIYLSLSSSGSDQLPPPPISSSMSTSHGRSISLPWFCRPCLRPPRSSPALSASQGIHLLSSLFSHEAYMLRFVIFCFWGKFLVWGLLVFFSMGALDEEHLNLELEIEMKNGCTELESGAPTRDFSNLTSLARSTWGYQQGRHKKKLLFVSLKALGEDTRGMHIHTIVGFFFMSLNLIPLRCSLILSISSKQLFFWGYCDWYRLVYVPLLLNLHVLLYLVLNWCVVEYMLLWFIIS